MTDTELIKAKIDIVDFLNDYIQLKKSGRSFKALCPFHSEKTPSFYVSPERGTWHCFGACNIGGDIFEFLMRWEHIEFTEALKILAKKAGVNLTSYQPTEAVKIKDTLYEINHLASEYYHYILTRHNLGKKALSYLKDRGLNDKIMDTFALGYAPDSWEGLLRFLKKKNYKDGDIISSGLVVKSDRGTIYDRFRGRVMFTLKDHRGNPVGFSGRILDKSADNQGAKYINTPETPVYIKGNILYGLDVTGEAIRKANETVVVEGEFDFLSSFQSGVSNIVAIKGSAFTEGQVNLIKRYTENVILALDSDFAGSQAAKKGIEAAENAGLFLKVVRLPFGKDPDECIKKDPRLWKKAVKDADNIYDFLIGHAFDLYDPETPQGKKKIGDETAPFLAKITNPIILSHYIKLLSKKLSVSEEAIESLIEKSTKPADRFTKAPSEKTTDSNRSQMLEEYLLSLVLAGKKPKEVLYSISAVVSADDFQNLPVGIIFASLNKYFSQNDGLDVKIIAQILPKEVLTVFDRAYLKDVDMLLKDQDRFEKEVKKTAIAVKQLAIRRRINILTTKLRKRNENDKEKKGDLNREITGLLKERNILEKEAV